MKQVTYEHESFDPLTRKRLKRSHVCRPTSSDDEAERTVKNLRLNKDVSNIELKDV